MLTVESNDGMVWVCVDGRKEDGEGDLCIFLKLSCIRHRRNE